MDFVLNFYSAFLYQPIYNLVVVLYNFSPGPNLGWAIVVLALIVRLFFLPFTLKGFKTDELLAEITPEVKKIELDPNLDSKAKRSKITTLLRSKGVNPMSEIYSLLGQILFIAILYQIVQVGIHPPFTKVYEFVPHPQDIDTIFFGIDISHPNLLYSAVAALALFVEQIWEYEDKKNIPEATFSGRWYPLLLPISTFILLMLLPATKAVFVFVSILFSIGIRIMVTLGRKGSQESAN